MSDHPTCIDLAAIECGAEAHALRGCLEELGLRHELRVQLHPIGRPSQLAKLLAEGAGEHLLLVCHGTKGGIVLPELPAELNENEPCGALLLPADMQQLASLDGRMVVSTGCSTGNPELAASFLAAGASAYLAPVGDPDGEAAFGFCVAFYYALLYLDLPLAQAVERARSLGGESELFRLFA